jgi:hypothetical protein
MKRIEIIEKKERDERNVEIRAGSDRPLRRQTEPNNFHGMP